MRTIFRPTSCNTIADPRPRRHKHRLSYSLRRIRNKKREAAQVVAIFDTSYLHRQVPVLPEELKVLGEAQREFELFTSMVVEDLADKVARLRRFKSSSSTSYSDHSYASLQIFMLQMYSSRIETFKGRAARSIEEICTRFEQRESAEKLAASVQTFQNGLSKMKTRMKHMIDVSDKYAVIEIFDTINIFNKVSLSLDCSDAYDRDLHTFTSLGNILVDCPPTELTRRKASEASSISSNSSSFSSSEERSSSNVKTLRSISDHVCVLSKTYVTAMYKRS